MVKSEKRTIFGVCVFMKRTNVNYSYSDNLFINLWKPKNSSPPQELIITPWKKEAKHRKDSMQYALEVVLLNIKFRLNVTKWHFIIFHNI